MTDIIERATLLAKYAHHGQTRKWTDEPYIVHPMAVAARVRLITNDPEAIAAAILHDTVEDTWVDLNHIEEHFGARVASMVNGLTEQSKLSDGNRATRKAIDLKHYEQQEPIVQTIKLLDMMDNAHTVLIYGGDFTEIFMDEFAEMYYSLTSAHEDVRRSTCRMWGSYLDAIRL